MSFLLETITVEETVFGGHTALLFHIACVFVTGPGHLKSGWLVVFVSDHFLEH